MQLTIQNYTKVVGTKLHQNRFVCTLAQQTPTNYRFQFKDNGSPQLRIIWIEISRMGEWDAADGGNWTYRLNYPNRPLHIVTAKWLGFPPNAVSMMEDCLKYSL
jgi:hypothetical protein